MKRLFSTIAAILITSHAALAQKEVVYSKSFDTTKETTMIINLENSTAAIQPSTDGKVHIYYALEFDNYGKKAIKEILGNVKVQATQFEDHITLMSSSVSKINKITYAFNESISIEGDFFKSKDSLKTVVRKSKDSIVREIRVNNFKPLSFLSNKFKIKGEDGELVNLRKGNVKIMRSTYVIKVPPYLKLNVNAKESQVTFREDIINELTVDLKHGFLHAAELRNEYNQIKVENADFKVIGIDGGSYTLNNVPKGLIGSTKDVKLNSEFSKMEIGTIEKGTVITDFNSTLWFYNFADDFKRFDLYSEYSKIHFFYPEADHSFKVFGHNTVNHIGGMKIEMQPNKKGEKFNMMERKAKGEGVFSGHINFDIVHGIIYSHNDSILTINSDLIIKNDN